ncbi:hypothetical protein P171DRAFT_486146 [Karstenula rhodostoma CBS 690.94]|uniref:Uncharacterized protein n=1 Tax=Karstenula rhodostoma CBS 690.94 TaxID=1392251 RepID=A0A9P4PHG5_9PLEO|nr:hypothetical protein P171DRAFT_486146 [Karstenula rhodostoma CBS 690.94]
MTPNNPTEQTQRETDVPPPVPPKDTTDDTRLRRRRPPPLTGAAVKPLPPPPPVSNVRVEQSESGIWNAPPRTREGIHFDQPKGRIGKPLPRIPWRPDYRRTFLWIGGLGVWFLLVVLLLPVFLEGDALPRLNRTLRSHLALLLG